VEHVSADVLPSCDDMRRICEKVGFKASQANDAGIQKFEITL
jgi:hypothetical protein